MNTVTLDDLLEDELVIPDTERRPRTPLQRLWADEGVVILEGLVDEATIAAYERCWLRENGGPGARLGDLATYRKPGGWPDPVPYMRYPELLALCCHPAIAATLEELTGEPMGVHLNLTCWRSTLRQWHSDQYLNPPGVGGFYAAVWLALDEIHPDSGPFEFVPESHRWWPGISQAKIRHLLGPEGDSPCWPLRSERILTPLFEGELARRAVTPSRFLGRRGDVLVWHSRLLHQGSTPMDRGRERRGLIVHYSGIHHRPDMPKAVRHPAGGWYFPIQP